LETVETIVVGAGAVGLAIGRELALAGQEVIVLECCDAVGTQTSSRNSEVIHAGIYYPGDWLKTSLCIAGRQQLYEYCESRGVPCERVGKLIVATNEAQRPGLDRRLDQAHANGLASIHRVDRQEISRLEPAVQAVAGLMSPETGIIDSHQLMLSLQGDLEASGGLVCLGSPFEAARATGAGFEVEIGGEGAFQLGCHRLINSAGLGAQQVAGKIDGLNPGQIPTRWLARGQYYTLQGKSPFSRLVYPLPIEGGLGIHVTLDMGGQARFGPDVHWINEIDYDFDETVVAKVADDIRQYFPALDESYLQPGYTGIRPKLSGPGESASDFVISGPQDHGLPGLVNLFGIESPGLTAVLSLAEYVRRLVD